MSYRFVVSVAVLVQFSMAGFSSGAGAQTQIAPVDDGDADSVITVGEDETIPTTGDTRGIRSTGERARITVHGTIDTTGPGADGVFSEGDDATVTVDGRIMTAGDNADGIYSDGEDTTITLDGTITTTGGHARGIDSHNAGVAVTVNAGARIETTGTDSDGIFSRDGAGATITVDGTIDTGAMDADGIRSRGTGAEIAVGGTIGTRGDNADGITSAGADADITVGGTITTEGDGAHGVRSSGSGAGILVSGGIETAGGGAYGVLSTGAGADITVTGTLRIGGGSYTPAPERPEIVRFAYGIRSGGADAEIAVDGRIDTTEDGVHGIFSTGGDGDDDDDRGTVIGVDGRIGTGGADAYGIRSGGANADIAVGGTIETAGAGAHGIRSEGANAGIAVAGTIRTSGAGAHGIHVTGGGDTIEVSGEIHAAGPDSYAILGEGGQTVCLLPGWRVTGEIRLEAGAANRLVIKTDGDDDMSDVIHVTNLDDVETDGDRPVLVSDDRVTILDPSAPSMQRVMLVHVAGAVHGAIHDAAERPVADDGRPFWGTAIGVDFRRGGDGAALGWDGRLHGVVGGVEGRLRDGLRVGVVGGYARSGSATGIASIDADAGTAVLGVYGVTGGDLASGGKWAVTGALVGGYSDHDTTRLVRDNMAGLQRVRGSHRGLFASPSLGLRLSHPVAEKYELRPSARVDGVFARHGPYVEGGADGAGVAYGSWTSVSAGGRAQLGLAIPLGPSAEFEARVGATGRFHSGDRMTARLAGGAPVSWDVPGDRSVSGGFVGGRLTWALGDRFSLVANAEYGRAGGGERALSGRLKLFASF